jgi:hypothetical protein
MAQKSATVEQVNTRIGMALNARKKRLPIVQGAGTGSSGSLAGANQVVIIVGFFAAHKRKIENTWYFKALVFRAWSRERRTDSAGSGFARLGGAEGKGQPC